MPTLAIGDEMFWGSDALEFALAALDDPSLLNSEEMRRAAKIPPGAERLAKP